jgi:hypothetical protein
LNFYLLVCIVYTGPLVASKSTAKPCYQDLHRRRTPWQPEHKDDDRIAEPAQQAITAKDGSSYWEKFRKRTEVSKVPAHEKHPTLDDEYRDTTNYFGDLDVQLGYGARYDVNHSPAEVRRPRGANVPRWPVRRSQGFQRDMDSYHETRRSSSLSLYHDPWVERFRDENPSYSYTQREQSASFSEDHDTQRNRPARSTRGWRGRGRGHELPPRHSRGTSRRESSYDYSPRRRSVSSRGDSPLESGQFHDQYSPSCKDIKPYRGSGQKGKRGNRGGKRGSSLDRPEYDRMAASVDNPRHDTLPPRPPTPPQGAGHGFRGTGKGLSAEDGHQWSRDEELSSKGRGKTRVRGRGRGGRGQAK